MDPDRASMLILSLKPILNHLGFRSRPDVGGQWYDLELCGRSVVSRFSRLASLVYGSGNTILWSEPGRQSSIQYTPLMQSVFSARHAPPLLRGRILRNDSPFLPSRYQKEDVHPRPAELVLLRGGFHRL